MVEQAADQLQGDVLERKGRAVEELQQMMPGLQLDQRTHLRCRERRIGVADHRRELVRFDRITDERLHHGRRQLGIRRGLGVTENRPLLGEIEATIGRQTAEQGVGETDARCPAAGTLVPHRRRLSRRRREAAN